MHTSHELFELASVAVACQDRETLLKTFAARAGAILEAQAVLVWLKDSASAKFTCAAAWCESGMPAPMRPLNGAGGIGLVERAAQSRQMKRVESPEIRSLSFPYLQDTFRSELSSALYFPILGVQESLGTIEALRTKPKPFTDDAAQTLEEASCLLAQALKNLEDLSEERQGQLATIERLTTLYDLGRTFTSSLELTELLPIVGGKIRDVVEAAACNLWLVDSRSQELYLAQKTGADPTAEEGARVSSNEGVLGEVLQHASPKLLEHPENEPSLAPRVQAAPGFALSSWMGVPLRKGDEVLGIVEALNKRDGTAFTEDDLFFLASISEQAAISLHNAKLLESERKVSALNALLKVSREIAATPDLDRVLTTVVNQAGTMVNFDRLVIGYFDRGRFVLGAVSGEAEVPQNAETGELCQLLAWVARQSDAVSADFYPDGCRMDPEAARPICVPFLEAHQYQGFYGIPLHDDQGAVGAMALLSGQGNFLSLTDREVLAILANQTAVAVRNSQLYGRSRFTGLLRPLLLQGNSRQELLLSYARRVAAILAVLVIVPWPLRVSTQATVVPAQRRIVSSTAGGVIEGVAIKEGDVVQAGDILAQLNDGEDRIKLAQARAALETARRELGEAEFKNDPAAAGQARIRADLHLAEVQLEEKRLSEARIRSSLTGVVVTPKVEEKVGTLLKPGEGFAEIVEQDRMAAELSVPEGELPLVRPGGNVALKLNAFPTRTLQGTIDRVGAQSRSEANEQYFIVRASFPNPGGVVKDGMVGRARVRACGGWFQSGWYPVGYVLLRVPVRWLWMKLWTLLP